MLLPSAPQLVRQTVKCPSTAACPAPPHTPERSRQRHLQEHQVYFPSLLQQRLRPCAQAEDVWHYLLHAFMPTIISWTFWLRAPPCTPFLPMRKIRALGVLPIQMDLLSLPLLLTSITLSSSTSRLSRITLHFLPAMVIPVSRNVFRSWPVIKPTS